MYSLHQLLELTMQPGEEMRMRDYLYGRGTRDQLKLFPDNNPQIEPKPWVTNKVVGWSWDEPNTLEEMEDMKDVADAVLGRELQTLEDVRKIIKRLLDRGYEPAKIKAFILRYIKMP